jgi:hypothetical protein
MNTEQLIDVLAARAAPIAPRYVMRRYASALAAGTACALVAMLAGLGPRHDLALAIDLPMFWVKLSFVAAMATLGIAGAWRASLPGRPVRGVWRSFALVAASIWLVAAIALFQAPPGTRLGLVLGDTWRVCPWLIAALSVPLFVAVTRFVRRMAPTDLRRAGAMSGFVSGATAALVYSFHCPELEAPFLATWYLIGMLLPALVGWALGERLFHW